MKLRSQIDAPIELVVAVIILSASLAITFFVINSTTNSQCEAELRDSARELGNAMIDISLNSPPAKREVFFNFKACSNYQISALRFIRYNDPAYCNACKGRYGGCWKVEPLYLQDEGDSKRQYVLHDAEQCVDLSSDIGIEQKPDSKNTCAPLNPELTMKSIDSTKVEPDDDIKINGKPAYDQVQILGNQGSEGATWKIILEKESKISGGKISGYIDICAVNLNS